MIIFAWELVDILRKNDIIEADIESTGYDGEGVARVDGYPVFVRGTVEGDRVEIRILKANKGYAFGKAERIIAPSVFRREPPCASFGRCGGCTMMHVSYHKQLDVKEQSVKDNLRRIAHLNDGDYLFEGILGAEEFNYRNKAQFPVKQEPEGAVYGFYASGSHRVVSCDNCRIQDETINRVANGILEYINENKVPVYDESTGAGIVRHIYVRASREGEAVAVIVANTHHPLPHADRLVEKLTAIRGVTGIIQNVNTRRDNIIMGSENITIWGKESLRLTLGGLKFDVSPNSFFQVNTAQAEKLYAKALEYANLTGTETLFDLYCGVGSISLYMAGAAGYVYGVELVEPAVENACANAKLNGIDNVQFHAGDCAEVVDRLMKDGASADVVVVDPPRKGCDEALLELISRMSPKRLVYVSCNSATLARDIDALKKYGYRLVKAAAVDLFPQTAHVECCVLLCRT